MNDKTTSSPKKLKLPLRWSPAECFKLTLVASSPRRRLSTVHHVLRLVRDEPAPSAYDPSHDTAYWPRPSIR